MNSSNLSNGANPSNESCEMIRSTEFNGPNSVNSPGPPKYDPPGPKKQDNSSNSTSERLNSSSYSSMGKVNTTSNSVLESTPNHSSETPINGSYKRKLGMSDFEMWRYTYHLVKNGHSILAPEPSQRSRSYRDLIMQEMNWMAVDYYQERRWKSHIAKEISNSITTSIIDRKRLKRDWPAKICSYNIEQFWINIKLVTNGTINTISRHKSVKVHGKHRHSHHSVNNVNGDNGNSIKSSSSSNGSSEGSVNGNGREVGIVLSSSLMDYCTRIVAGRRIDFRKQDIVEDVPRRRSELLALTVPVYKNVNTNSVNIAKKEVVDATVNQMVVLGAELYPQLHRPPDDEIDVFTLPALNPKHEYDYNTLLLLLHSLKATMFASVRDSAVGLPKPATTTTTAPTGLSSLLPIRRIPRDEIDPLSLSVNYRDFIDNSSVQSPHPQKLVLKWEEPTLNEADFELVDTWLLESRCWPLISIALNLRSSSGGLLRREFSPKACKEAFYRMSKPPRGLVNSSKKILSPKQSKTILSFINPPPKTFKFTPIISSDRMTSPRTGPPTSQPSTSSETGIKNVFGEVCSYLRDKSSLYTCSTPLLSKKESFFSRFKSPDPKPDKRLLLKLVNKVDSNVHKNDLFLVPHNVKVEASLSLNPHNHIFPQELLNFILSNVQTQGDDNVEQSLDVTSKTRYLLCGNDKYGATHRFSSLNSAVTLATSVSSYDNVVRNFAYSELSTRINKQLRIGFLGIPTKMFLYSLFYCGRIKPDYRVRRVALSIATLGKFIPPPHLLYGKMFDPDINLILTKSRPSSYEKQRSKSVENQEAFTSELVQNYSKEIYLSTNTKPDENNVPTLLASFTQVSLSKGKVCNQSSFSPKKIVRKPTQYITMGNASNASSTPTERKRHVGSMDTTPRQKARQLAEVSTPSETTSMYRTRQEVMMRRQMPQPHMQHYHPYSVPMVYPMNSVNSMQNMNMNMNTMGNVNNMSNVNMSNVNNMGNVNNVNSMSNVNNLNNMGNMNTMSGMGMMGSHHMNSPLEQPLGMNSMPNMNSMANMGAMGNMNPMGNMNHKMYNLQNTQMQHFQDDNYHFRYDQRPNNHP
uniref:HSA domain-containing protein n=2 Tax=Theileria parva TaxID=5875 RepID=Q4N4Y6_THEPA|eukprot:XP_765070.1 hypothetical protein [Theileria parva strain Muguga]